jgi:ATP-dependent RNA helicase DeaD
MTFFDFNLPEALYASLKEMNFTAPTPIQEQAIPIALEGKDVLGSAQTGTGKTAAFCIPLIAKLLTESTGSALILTPTRELAMQVSTVVNQLIGKNRQLKSALLIGGDSMHKQFQQLRNKPRVFVGTPGRVNDHLRRKSLRLDDTNFLVLDETDRMLDMGFGIQLDEIMPYLPQERQTLMFSATLPREIVSLSKKYLNEPQHIEIGRTSTPIENIDQKSIKLPESKKYQTLVDEIEARSGSIIVFVKTKISADEIAYRLFEESGISARPVHGDLHQRKREKVVKDFRNQKFRVLIATDVASRGLDIPHIEHVINHDIPYCAEEYIHRIGRTARAGAKGSALNLISPSDSRKWHAIERLLNPDLYKSEKQSGPRSDSSRSSRNDNGRRRSFSDNKFGDRKPADRRSAGSRFGEKRFDDRNDDRKFGDRKFADRKPKRSYSEGGSNDYDERLDTRSGGYKSFGRKESSEGRFGSREDSRGESKRDFPPKRSSLGFGKKPSRSNERSGFESREEKDNVVPFRRNTSKPGGFKKSFSDGPSSERPFRRSANAGPKRNRG